MKRLAGFFVFDVGFFVLLYLAGITKNSHLVLLYLTVANALGYIEGRSRAWRRT